MQRKYSNLILLALWVAICASCSEDSPLESEQYMKQIYIVGADETTNMGMTTVEVPYSSSEQETFISVATSGSLNIDRDIVVTIEEAGTTAIEDYNFKYLEDEDVQYQMMDASGYRIPDYDVAINAGEVYGKMPIYVVSEGLSCDSLYALTFQIHSVDDPNYISIRDEDTVLILAFTFINDYSGTYQADGYYYEWTDNAPAGDSVSISTTRVFTAVDANTVRFYHLANTESADNIDAYGVTMTIADDNSLLVEPWGSLDITDAEGTYNPNTETFTIWYNYRLDTTEYQFSGKYVKEDS